MLDSRRMPTDLSFERAEAQAAAEAEAEAEAATIGAAAAAAARTPSPPPQQRSGRASLAGRTSVASSNAPPTRRRPGDVPVARRPMPVHRAGLGNDDDAQRRSSSSSDDDLDDNTRHVSFDAAAMAGAAEPLHNADLRESRFPVSPVATQWPAAGLATRSPSAPRSAATATAHLHPPGRADDAANMPPLTSPRRWERHTALLDMFLGTTATVDRRGGGADLHNHVAPHAKVEVYARWVDAMERILTEEKFRILDLFRRFDANGDGFITRDELYEGLGNLNLNFGPAEVHLIVDQLDRQNKNQISASLDPGRGSPCQPAPRPAPFGSSSHPASFSLFPFTFLPPPLSKASRTLRAICTTAAGLVPASTSVAVACCAPRKALARPAPRQQRAWHRPPRAAARPSEGRPSVAQQHIPPPHTAAARFPQHGRAARRRARSRPRQTSSGSQRAAATVGPAAAAWPAATMVPAA